MAKVVVLGGSGGIGSVATRALAALEDFDEIVVADVRQDAAAELARNTGRAGVRAIAVDATREASLDQALRGADVVLNCIGPFYRFGVPVLTAAIRAGVDYVDVCDDLEPTLAMLELDAEAKRAGVSALVGMGNSPGLANVFVRMCAESFLDDVEAADIMHIHGGEPEEGPAVTKHRIHAMTSDVPLFIDGKMIKVRQLEESGREHTIETEFRGLGRYPVYPYPHPETVTLPRYLPGIRRVTNLGVIFPLSLFKLTQDMVRVGACTEEPLEVGGRKIIPLEFSVAHILSQRSRLLAEAGIDGPAGCLKVVVAGTKGGEKRSIVFSLSSSSAGAGEGTGIPAAVGAILMQRGRIEPKGVFPPEAGVVPFDMLGIALDLVKRLGVGGGAGIHVESIDASGKVTEIPIG